jgi:hypothetical protein
MKTAILSRTQRRELASHSRFRIAFAFPHHRTDQQNRGQVQLHLAQPFSLGCAISRFVRSFVSRAHSCMAG